jgi:hypothetical protein
LLVGNTGKLPDQTLQETTIMSQYKFPPIPLREWQPTLNTLQKYAHLLGKVRKSLTPRQKHVFHISLRVNGIGLTTTPILAPPDTFEMQLDLAGHRLIMTTSTGRRWETPLMGQSPAQFMEEALAALATFGITPEIERETFTSTEPGTYDRKAVERFWRALAPIDSLFNQFKGEQRKGTSPVQLWTHHFDLAMLWFSGRLVPGQDPEDEEYSDEQMNFGFLPGDESIPEPYFYITAYPTPEGLTNTPLPDGAYWLTEGFTGAILPYHAITDSPNPDEKILTYLRTVQQAGADLMNQEQ